MFFIVITRKHRRKWNRLEKITKLIDHTILAADATKEDVMRICQEAKQYGFASVCIQPSWVKFVSEQLMSTDVKVCTVIGFPLGATSTRAKAYEAEVALEDGAEELDMVINIGALKSGEYELVKADIAAVCKVVQKPAIVKVIIETALLTDEEKKIACTLAKEAGADFVKTSTGFSTAGATTKDIELMRAVVGPNLGVKASGGIRTYNDIQKMVAAGANRIGASSGVAIIEGEISKADY